MPSGRPDRIARVGRLLRRVLAAACLLAVTPHANAQLAAMAEFTYQRQYTGPELGRLAESSGQRNIHGGYNWDTRVRNRSAKYTVIVGSDAVRPPKLGPEQLQKLAEGAR